MALLTLQDLDTESPTFDGFVARSDHLDQFCSSSAWVLSAHEGLMGAREAWVWRSEAGMAAIARRESPRLGVFYEPLEAMWGFASPFVGPRLDQLAGEVIDELAEQPEWRAILVTGVDLEGPLPLALANHCQPGWRLALGLRTRRRRASLEGGVFGYLGRRSANFRRNLVRVERKAERAGVTLEIVRRFDEDPDCEAVYGRVLDIERRSWKGQLAIGIQSGRMRAFYRLMLPRLARAGALRVAFARRDGADLAYHMGGLFASTYRGLQHSFDDDYRGLSLGTLVHAHILEHICDEGVPLYDLGQDTPYKARWSENTWDTHTLAVLREAEG